MARIEKTVFISYRRKDSAWALAVYQYLTGQKYDVFFDYTSIPSGDFEQVIVSNIKARAHFVLILTPTALDRCGNPGDWLRREIETAIDEKRNIIPLFFDGFNFGNAAVSEKLTGKLAILNRYNGLDIPSGYFMEAMERLRSRYLNVPLNAVLHPVSAAVQKVIKEEKVAADKAVLEKREDIQKLVKPAEEKSEKPSQIQEEKATVFPSPERIGGKKDVKIPDFRLYGIGAGVLLIAALGIYGIRSLMQVASVDEPAIPTLTQSLPTLVATKAVPTYTRSAPTNTSTKTPNLPTPTPGIGSTMISTQDGMVMIYVPAGEFTMGDNEGFSMEKPAHSVYLDAYWIDKTEVTNSMYAKCVDEGKCGLPSSLNSDTRENYFGSSEYFDFPVIYVSWEDAQSYCEWAGRKLPTEAEWEKAASWDSSKLEKRIYPWGDSIDCSFANYWGKDDTCVGDTAKTGSYPKGASFFGVFDMGGNVWEWVADWYSDTYYEDSQYSNPVGPDLGEYRVFRGGTWIVEFFDIRTTSRYSGISTLSSPHIGFRCAMSASE